MTAVCREPACHTQYPKNFQTNLGAVSNAPVDVIQKLRQGLQLSVCLGLHTHARSVCMQEGGSVSNFLIFHYY